MSTPRWSRRTRSPGCSTSRHGQPGCASSSAKNAPTPARSCGSPTSTAIGSPPSPPTPAEGNLLTSSCATADARGARTASGSARTPGYETCPARLRPEPDLAHHHRPGRRAHRLVATTRLHRPPRTQMGTQTTPPAAVLHRRPDRRSRPNPTAALARSRPVSRTPHDRHPTTPAHTSAQLNRDQPPRQTRKPDRPVEPAHRATSAKPSCPYGTIPNHRDCRPRSNSPTTCPRKIWVSDVRGGWWFGRARDAAAVGCRGLRGGAAASPRRR